MLNKTLDNHTEGPYADHETLLSEEDSIPLTNREKLFLFICFKVCLCAFGISLHHINNEYQAHYQKCQDMFNQQNMLPIAENITNRHNLRSFTVISQDNACVFRYDR